MDRKDKSLIGALVPKYYANELWDKLHNNYPGMRMTYLIRTLLGMWFDGDIVIKRRDIMQYKADRRQYNKFGNKVVSEAQALGRTAAAEQFPLSANPFNPESGSYAAWEKGWRGYFNQE